MRRTVSFLSLAGVGRIAGVACLILHLELAMWIIEMWRQDASHDTWGRLKYCLSLEEPDRSECLRKVKGDD